MIPPLEIFLHRKLPEYLKLLESWVQINSHTLHAAGVERLARLTARAFEPLGFRADFCPAAEAGLGPHLFLHRPAPGKPTIVLVSHLDTVYTAEEERAHDFHFHRDGDRVYGPGVGDIKGGTLAALMVLDALAQHLPHVLDAANWLVALNAGEEILAPSFPVALRARWHPPVAAMLIFEGGTLVADHWPLVVARKGRIDFRIHVSGRGAHAGVDFWSGENAVVAAAELIPRLAALSDRDDEVTLNVGRFCGGKRELNRVPHEAVIDGEVRFHGSRLDEFQAKISAIAAGCRTSAVATFPTGSASWPENSGSDRLFDLWQAAGKTLGMNVTRQRRGGLSDGNHFWAEVPTLDGLGPVAAFCHCSERTLDGSKTPEFILPATLVPKALLSCVALEAFTRDWQRGDAKP